MTEEMAGGNQAHDLEILPPGRHLAAEVGHGGSLPDFARPRYGDRGLKQRHRAAGSQPDGGAGEAQLVGSGRSQTSTRPSCRARARAFQARGGRLRPAGAGAHRRPRGRRCPTPWSRIPPGGRWTGTGSRRARCRSSSCRSWPRPEATGRAPRSGRRACPTSRRQAAAPAAHRYASRSGRSRRADAASAAPARRGRNGCRGWRCSSRPRA